MTVAYPAARPYLGGRHALAGGIDPSRFQGPVPAHLARPYEEDDSAERPEPSQPTRPASPLVPCRHCGGKTRARSRYPDGTQSRCCLACGRYGRYDPQNPAADLAQPRQNAKPRRAPRPGQPLCPRCGNGMRKHGRRNGRQVLLCGKCGKCVRTAIALLQEREDP